MAWRPEVIADRSGKWVSNALRFETQSEADAYLAHLTLRWTAVRETRSVKVAEPVTYRWNFTTQQAEPLPRGDDIA